VKIRIPQADQADQAVTRETFSFQVDKPKSKAAEQRDGHYLLRSNLGEDPAVLWTRYVQLTQIESVFRALKSELGIRPVHHQLEHRADAHVLIAFLAYCLQVTLKNRAMIHAPGLTPAAVLEKMATIPMVEVWIPTLDGRWLILPRHTQPEKMCRPCWIISKSVCHPNRRRVSRRPVSPLLDCRRPAPSILVVKTLG